MIAKIKLNRFLSVLLSITILVSYFPATKLVAAAPESDSGITRVSDASTMDSWKQFFLADELSTQNAGGIWTDKSVLTNADAFAGTGIQMNEDNSFLVALSAMASNITIAGHSEIPTDTMLVLDVSGSMNDGDNDVAEELVDAANESIHTLLSENEYNRVGVVLYSGPNTIGGSASSNDAVLMLPLGRYQTAQDGEYLSYSKSGRGGATNTTETISLDRDVVIEGTGNRPSSKSKEVYGATYIQKGIILAKDQLVAADTTITDDILGTVTRSPIVVLMSDGAPTCSDTDFTNPGSYDLGTGSSTSASAAQAFVTQLSAAYAKQQIEEKYKTDCLFYTLGLAVNDDAIATSVLNPENSTNAVNEYWKDWNNAAVGEKLEVEKNKYVEKIAGLKQIYVDKNFDVDNKTDLAQGLKDAFAEIVMDIQLQSKILPTLISDNKDVSGYISFVDKINDYMEVTDVKGILIHNTLFSGANLCSNFVSSGGQLGSYGSPSDLGNEMVWAVQQRLGIDDVETARTLIGLAYTSGQLSYDEQTGEFSNYIGWYANADGKYLGFYQDGVTELPAATGDRETDPVFTIKSYGYLGEVDEEHGVEKSDMMYATVQVRKNIATGEQTVAFAIPAALVPILTYNVTLDENKNLTDLTTSGAEHPMRLVYEVALKDGINQYTVNDVVSDDYLKQNTNHDGSVNFYPSQWMPLVTEGQYNQTTTNTYAYFNPSKQNDRYYYLENTPVLVKNSNGTYQAYNGEAIPTGEKYYGYKVYTKAADGTKSIKTIYTQFAAEILETAQSNGDNTWYIPAGTVHVNLHQLFEIYKGGNFEYDPQANATGTINYAHYPVVDTRRYVDTNDGHNYYAAAVLGNNGRLSVASETGIKLSKRLADGATPTTQEFEFEITNTKNTSDSNTYDALLVLADGTQNTTTVQFDKGTAKVYLKPDEAIYIGGMTPDDVITVKETEKLDYHVQSVNGNADAHSATLTVTANEFAEADFVNADRGKGDLTVAKQIKHDLGANYVIPDKSFEITVTLSGIAAQLQTLNAQLGDKDITITPQNGQFTVSLKHNEQLTVFDLPEGTKAEVKEAAPGTGFTESYYENGADTKGDGIVTVPNDSIATVLIVNDFTANKVSDINLNVGGTKYLKDENGEDAEWKDSYKFYAKLQQYVDTPDFTGWVDVDSAVVDKDNQAFTFDLSKLEFNNPGVYSFQAFEYIPDGEASIDGIYYDGLWHTFSVTVSDKEMDGTLEIVGVECEHEDSSEKF